MTAPLAALQAGCPRLGWIVRPSSAARLNRNRRPCIRQCGSSICGWKLHRPTRNGKHYSSLADVRRPAVASMLQWARPKAWPSSHGLVAREEVRRIVPLLKLGDALVVRPVRLVDAMLAFFERVLQSVDVDGWFEQRLRAAPQSR